MLAMHGRWVRIYWAGSLALVPLSLVLALWYAPIDETMGPIQKIVYLHVPAAINAFLACAVVSFASVAYTWQRRPEWDDLAHAGAQVSVVFCTVVLLTGMLWGRQTWGHWWAWSPRLTFSLVLLLLYVAYLLIRPAVHSPERRALVCAVYGTIAFLDVPLVYLSTRLLPDIHPSEMDLSGPMQTTMFAWLLTITLLAGGMVLTRFSLNSRARKLEHPDEGGVAPGPHPRIPGARA